MIAKAIMTQLQDCAPKSSSDAVLSFAERLSIARNVTFTPVETEGTSPSINFDASILQIIARQAELPVERLVRMFDPSFIRAHSSGWRASVNAASQPNASSAISFVPRDQAQDLLHRVICQLAPDQWEAAAREIERAAGAVDAVVRGQAFQALVDGVSGLLIEVCVFELSLAATEKLVSSDTPSDALVGFSELLKDAAYVSYLQDKYPVLIPRLCERLALASRSLSKFFTRLRDDWSDLRIQLDCEEKEPIIEALVRDAGDSHNGADAVTIVKLRGNFFVVYKPRSVSAEAGTQHFLAWMDSLHEGLRHRVLWVVDRKEYGWVEFVPASELATKGAESRYFERYGRLLAAMHFINATDIHHENLIASGEFPVVVDLETILQPTRITSRDGDASYLMDLEFYQKSPLFTAMIDPVFFESALNSSPLATDLSRKTRTRVLELTAKGTFRVRATASEERVSHLPRREGRPVDPFQYRRDIERGFRSAYQDLLRHKVFLLGRGLDAWFKDARIRVIFKATARYGKILSALNSAYAQGGTEQQDEYLSKLWRSCIAKPAMARVVLAEINDLWRGDIPYFSAEVATTDVLDSAGQIIDKLLVQSALDATRDKVALLTTSTLEMDAAVVEACLARRARDAEIPVITRETGNDEEVSFTIGASHRTIFATIRKCLRLEDHRLTFVDLNSTKDHSVRHRPLGADLYTGLPGVCFALAYDSASSGDCADFDHSQALAAHCFSSFDEAGSYTVGMCQGAGGLAYVASHLASLWQDEGYAQIGVALCDRMRASVYSDRHFDIFSGAAGGVLASLSVAKVDPSGRALETAAALCKHLRDFAIHRDDAATWLSSIPSRGPTTGFAHGVSGISFALARAYEVLGLPYLLDLALSSERFVHSCFRPAQRSWLEDESDKRDHRMEVWCHGAPGIAGMYGALRNITEDIEIAERYETAIVVTAEHIDFENDSLCHGTLGNVDALLPLRHVAKAPVRASELLCNLEQRLGARRVLCGNRYKHFSQSLFNGFSGIAYQLLRIRSSGAMPSVLTFDPPHQ